MTYSESMKYLTNLPAKYNFTQEEKEAFANVLYVCKKKADAEKSVPTCLYYVGKYYYKEWKNALTAAKNMKEKYIIEKHTDKDGNITSKRYTIVNGKILGVRKL